MAGPGGDGDETSSSARKRRRRPEPSPTQRAMGLLVRREHSRRELTRKLSAKGVDAGEAEQAIARLAEAGWQDDARFAEFLVRNRAQSGYGPRYIEAELGTHGLNHEAVEAALATFDGDWLEVARSLLRRRYGDVQPLDLAGQRKAMDLLLRRGHGLSEARAALQAMGSRD